METEIISKGQKISVSETELNELRSRGLSWLAYCQARLTRSHPRAVEHLTRFQLSSRH